MYSDRQKELNAFLRQLQLSVEEKTGENHKVQQLADTNRITKEEKEAEIKELTDQRTYSSMMGELFR